MNDEMASGQDEQIDTTDPALVEAIAKIKHPPSIDETLMAQSKDELTSNPVVVPQMINESADLRGDLKRDE